MNKKVRNIRTALFLLPIICIDFFGCKSESSYKKNIDSKTNSDTLQFKVDSTSHYYAISSSVANNITQPVIVFLDPQGNGHKPVKKYKKLVSENSITLIGLNRVKNNQSVFLQEINNAIVSAKQNNLINPNQPVIIAGFSGGARMGFYYALTTNIYGVIMCGAGPGNLSLHNLQSPVAILTGTQDFNFIESYYPPNSPIIKNKKLIGLHFQGKHEWPPFTNFKDALAFVFASNENGLTDENEFYKKCNAHELELNILEAYKYAEIGYKITSEQLSGKYLQKLKQFTNDKIYTSFFYKLQNELQEEQKRNNNLLVALDEQNKDWWIEQLEFLENQIHETHDDVSSDSYARTKAFLGIVIFSKIQNSIDANKEKLSDKLIYIYETLEPINPDVFYFKALFYAKQGDSNLSKENLIKAVKYGFNDLSRLMNDFKTLLPEEFLENLL